MNAKKIMGAVLVALLAAALFTGVGAAATQSGESVYLYQKVDGIVTAGSTWTLKDGAVAITAGQIDGVVFFAPTANFVEGVYENGANNLTIKNPAAIITGVAKPGAYSVVGGTSYADEATLYFTSGIPVVGVLVTDPNDVTTNVSVSGYTVDISTATKGKYTLQAILDPSAFVPAYADVAKVAVNTFTITKGSTEVTIAADKESINVYSPVKVTVTGQPGKKYYVTFDETAFDYVSSGAAVIDDINKATGELIITTMPTTGEVVLTLKSKAETGTQKIYAYEDGKKDAQKHVSVKIVAGAITGETEKPSYFIGDDVKISGTSTAGTALYLYIAGTNIDFQAVVDENSQQLSIDVSEGKWEKEIDAAYLKVKTDNQKLDAGSYSLYVATADLVAAQNAAGAGNAIDAEDIGTYAAIVLTLKQPFISVTDAPAVAVKGSDYTVTGTAEATTDLAVYVFGTNYFAATNGASVVAAGAGNLFASNPVTFDKNQFTIEFKIPKNDMAAGQYFMVIQHPMYDTVYNIHVDAAGSDYAINLTNTAGTEKTLFKVYERQTANAAQALCDALETQDIDDMYVKLSFVVAGPVSTINPIPSEITKGSKLTISGQTNLGEGENVIVEILSTAFAAVPKEQVGSASFIALTTKTNEDGSWEVTFDTSSLNVDEYTVSVAVGSLDSTTAKLNIVEGAPTEQPTTTPTTQPTQTEQPTTPPTTPGFGALAALAGLGAVAVLLLRRE